jgi:hypothetical protein
MGGRKAAAAPRIICTETGEAVRPRLRFRIRGKKRSGEQDCCDSKHQARRHLRFPDAPSGFSNAAAAILFHYRRAAPSDALGSRPRRRFVRDAPREIRRPCARKAAIRRLASAETPDRNSRTQGSRPAVFGGERRHIWRGSVGSRSSRLPEPSSCAVAECAAEPPCLGWSLPARYSTRSRDSDGESRQYSPGIGDHNYRSPAH